jgi:hypothetical protein
LDLAVTAVLGGFDGVLIAEPIAAGEGVVDVLVERDKKDRRQILWAAGKREPAAAKQEAMYFSWGEKSREGNGGVVSGSALITTQG